MRISSTTVGHWDAESRLLRMTMGGQENLKVSADAAKKLKEAMQKNMTAMAENTGGPTEAARIAQERINQVTSFADKTSVELRQFLQRFAADLYPTLAGEPEERLKTISEILGGGVTFRMSGSSIDITSMNIPALMEHWNTDLEGATKTLQGKVQEHMKSHADFPISAELRKEVEAATKASGEGAPAGSIDTRIATLQALDQRVTKEIREKLNAKKKTKGEEAIQSMTYGINRMGNGVLNAGCNWWATNIYYKMVSNDEGAQRWQWGSEEGVWMDTDKLVATAGFWEGSQPTSDNKKVIAKLDAFNKGSFA